MRTSSVRKIIPYYILFFFFLPGYSIAQRVMYSEPFNARPSVRIRVIGKSGDFYWIEKQQRTKSVYWQNLSDVPVQQTFTRMDAKLNFVRDYRPLNIAGMVKQWLVSSDSGLDQILLVMNEGKTQIIQNHFDSDEMPEPVSRTLDSLPFSTQTSRFILVRSADHSKNLLLIFENTNEDRSRLHALLYDGQWRKIYQQTISDQGFSQPFIQDEEIGFAAEPFDDLPIKLADNGEWLMASHSTISSNFSLLYVGPNGKKYSIKEIPLLPFYKMEDLAMSINEIDKEIRVGFLSSYQNSYLKSVQVCNYSMTSGAFDFDSSFHFTTKATDTRKNRLSHERFISIPEGGFMLLKEYGMESDQQVVKPTLMNPWETAYLLANYTEPFNGANGLNHGFIKNEGLSPLPFIQNSGDLNIFYFPAVSRDSSWSGTMEMEQHAELNNPDLSYFLVPYNHKLHLIYNSMEWKDEPMATSTVLNLHGQTAGENLVFWEMKKSLNFQQSRRFSKNEIAVPYMDRKGFAIIRL